MNLSELANIFPVTRDLVVIRKERVKREGSPYFTYTMAALAAAASISFDIERTFPAAKKYEPLDWLQFVNNEANNDLLLTINGNMTLPIPAGTIQTIKNQAIWHITITNLGGVITTLNKVVLTFQKQPLTADDAARGVR